MIVAHCLWMTLFLQSVTFDLLLDLESLEHILRIKYILYCCSPGPKLPRKFCLCYILKMCFIIWFSDSRDFLEYFLAAFYITLLLESSINRK